MLPLAFIYAYALQRSCMRWKGLFQALALIPILAPALRRIFSHIFIRPNYGVEGMKAYETTLIAEDEDPDGHSDALAAAAAAHKKAAKSSSTTAQKTKPKSRWQRRKDAMARSRDARSGNDRQQKSYKGKGGKGGK